MKAPYLPITDISGSPAEAQIALFGPSTAANLGGGIFTIAENSSSDIKFTIASLSTETIGVTISNDGTNYSAALRPIVDSTGKVAANATLGNGAYTLRKADIGCPKYVKFTKSAAVDTGTVAAGACILNRIF
jgi:hypothetical protein